MALPKDIELIITIGQLVDNLDLHLTSLKTYDDFDTKKVKHIEDEFKRFDKLEKSKEATALYHYTYANYRFFLNILANEDFELIKRISNYIDALDSKDNFLISNYAIRVESFRQAIKLVSEDLKLTKTAITQFYVNLANLFHEMGRIVESISVLRDAENVIDGFHMAKANLALKHETVANSMTGEKHNSSKAMFLYRNGLNLLTQTLKMATEKTIPSDSFEEFKKWESLMENIINNYFKDTTIWTIKEDIDEKYKKWSASNYLSLNYINTIYPYGNNDDIHIPNMGLGYFENSNNMEFYSWFNSIKQEYNMARYFVYLVTTEDDASGVKSHESQRNNTMINTLDYQVLGYKTELIKISLKEAFGVLDKIGLMCCKFHKVKMKAKNIDFNKWYKNIELELALKSPFKSLYWLSRDLDAKTGEMKNIRQLRNYLEHRFIRVLEFYDTPMSDEFNDDSKFEYKVDYNELYDKVMETLHIVRSAIFYMIIGFNKEYTITLNTIKEDQIFVPLLISEYDDVWKN